MRTIEEARAVDAKALAAFYAGQTEKHPHGLSGRRWMLLPENGKSCWDTSREGVRFSEWGQYCADPVPVSEVATLRHELALARAEIAALKRSR
jgi:hypothetical protein